MPLWALWLRDFDILNIFYDELKIEKMAKFETLIVPRGLIASFVHFFRHKIQALGRVSTDFRLGGEGSPRAV